MFVYAAKSAVGLQHCHHDCLAPVRD